MRLNSVRLSSKPSLPRLTLIDTDRTVALLMQTSPSQPFLGVPIDWWARRSAKPRKALLIGYTSEQMTMESVQRAARATNERLHTIRFIYF